MKLFNRWKPGPLLIKSRFTSLTSFVDDRKRPVTHLMSSIQYIVLHSPALAANAAKEPAIHLQTVKATRVVKTQPQSMLASQSDTQLSDPGIERKSVCDSEFLKGAGLKTTFLTKESLKMKYKGQLVNEQEQS